MEPTILRLVLLAVVLAVTAPLDETRIQIAAQENFDCSVTGELSLRQLTSNVFHNTRTLRVWLPPGYHTAGERNRRYPVLYLNDGQNLFDACTSIFNRQEWRVDETANELIRTGKIPPLIIVGIDNAGKRDRPREYLPFRDDTLKPAPPKVEGENYPKFLLDEVMPFVNHEYRTDPDPAKTGIGGSSYGAGIVLYAVMTCPGRFGKMLLESPSLYYDNDHLLRLAEGVSDWPQKIFIGVGTISEPKADVQRLATILRGHHLGDDRLKTVEERGAAHNELAWAHRFPQALQFLYGDRAQQ
jgi:predicted alpha/beta superfamily hydrolase